MSPLANAIVVVVVILVLLPCSARAVSADTRLQEIGTLQLSVGGDPSFGSNVARALRASGRFRIVESGADARLVGEGVWVAEGFLGRLSVVDSASGDTLWSASRLRRSAVRGDSMAFEQLIVQLRADLAALGE